MYDERVYMSCCRCLVVIRRDDAVRTEGLHGGFCSERCAILCLLENNPPLGIEQQSQAGDGPGGEQGPQYDDLCQRNSSGGQQ